MMNTGMGPNSDSVVESLYHFPILLLSHPIQLIMPQAILEMVLDYYSQQMLTPSLFLPCSLGAELDLPSSFQLYRQHKFWTMTQ